MPEKWTTFFDTILLSVKKKSTQAWIASFLLCLAVVLFNENTNRSIGGNIAEFAVGRVAERDVIADRDFSYVDETATRLRLEALERLVPAVFISSEVVSAELRNRWNHFIFMAERHNTEAQSAQAFSLALQSEFPGDFSDDILTRLYQSQYLHEIFSNCTVILDSVLSRGIFSMPQTGLENLNPDMVELIRQSGSRLEQERFPIRNIINSQQSVEAVRAYVESGQYNPIILQFAPELLRPFLMPNVFYSSEDTDRNLNAIRLTSEPVMRHIDQGTHIIRRGFVITQEEMENFHALRLNFPRNNLSASFAHLLFLLMLFILLFYFSGRRMIGRQLRDSEVFLVSGLTALYITGAVLVRDVYIMSIPASILVPTALIIMLNSILIHPRFALLLAFTLPLGAFLTGSFDSQAYFFALVSGVVAAYSLQGAEKRMDLVKAGLIIAAANLVAMMAVLLWQNSQVSLYPISLFWAAFNGIASGMLILGVLSPLEHVLKAATSFRLIELSDLNVPILRRLFTTAPGTYSHSIMVANLAEAACQDIGANPLLARVGAYYHDLGKMENPDYFVENQTDYNRHDDMPPRLSATVIRSHVKLGVEKARQLGLPEEVIEIVGEHHGNSLITWFYDKALKQESEQQKKTAINMEDFSYPGDTPQSRESAVVMLADVAEAAVRTLEKPTASKIEKFVQELIARKVETGQLANSELTFRDLEVIKNAFVRALAGYYHSRIEYPKLDEIIKNEQG